MIITQYDGVMTANMGLLKMDFLGLRTLTVISKALANIKANHGIDIDLDAIDMKDPAMYELFARGGTAGVFQVESPGMRVLLKKMRPDCYDDIVAVIALYRPGPLGAGMVDDFVDRKLGRKPVTYYDDRLKPVLESTYGTMVYQEQVMRISVVMSGFTTGESDKVRKAVAKKKIALMREVEQKWADGTVETMEDHWLNGAERNGYSRKIAQTIWDDVLKFAEYAFNKSHSAASPCRRPGSRRITPTSTWRLCSPATRARPTRSSTTSTRASKTASPCCRQTSTSPAVISRPFPRACASACRDSRAWARR